MTTPKELAAMPGVKVKALEWTEYETEGWADRADAEAGSFGVFYNIDIQKDGYRVVFDHEAVGAIGTFDTADEAMAAAQADYEARILSALEPAPAPETAGVVLERFSSAELQGYTGLLREDPEGDWVRYEDVTAALAARDAEIVRHHVTIHHADQRIAAANKRADEAEATLAVEGSDARAAHKAAAANLARAEQAEARVSALVADAALFRKIRELMGWVNDGSETTVTISQDDATRVFILQVGKEKFWSETFSGVIDKAALATSKQSGGEE